MTIMTTLRSWIDSVKFWKDKDVPGVADAIRKTQLKQEQKARQSDMQELIRMVKEGRIHEADERQLENLKLALELNNLIGAKQETTTTIEIGPEIAEAIKAALAEGLANAPQIIHAGGGSVTAPARPGMKHTMLNELEHEKTDLEVVGYMKGETGKSDDEAAKKRALLKKIKGDG